MCLPQGSDVLGLNLPFSQNTHVRLIEDAIRVNVNERLSVCILRLSDPQKDKADSKYKHGCTFLHVAAPWCLNREGPGLHQHALLQRCQREQRKRSKCRRGAGGRLAHGQGGGGVSAREGVRHQHLFRHHRGCRRQRETKPSGG